MLPRCGVPLLINEEGSEGREIRVLVTEEEDLRSIDASIERRYKTIIGKQGRVLKDETQAFL